MTVRLKVLRPLSCFAGLEFSLLGFHPIVAKNLDSLREGLFSSESLAVMVELAQVDVRLYVLVILGLLPNSTSIDMCGLVGDAGESMAAFCSTSNWKFLSASLVVAT